MDQHNCPDSSVLVEFILGTIAPEEVEVVAAHLRECGHCDVTMLQLEDTRDEVIEKLRRAPPRDVFAEESACRQAVAAIEAMGLDADASTRTNREARADTNQDSLVGEQLGQYRLLHELGRGGMGVVYKALHQKLEKFVALKVLRRERWHDPHTLARFEREMRAIGQYDHPHIVAATDAGEWRGMHFLVMEFIEGMDFANLLQCQRRLPIAAACEMVRQAALGLQEAHRRGMVHRDIKPSNLMLGRSRDGTQPPVVKILDLGLALLLDTPADSSHELTKTGQVMGTLDYVAPEQVDNSHTVDIRADIYSLGATLYKLLTGEVLFNSEQYPTRLQKLTALATLPVPPITDKRPDLPPGLAAIIHRMLDRQIEARFATPAEVATALEPFCAGHDLAALLQETPGAGIARQFDTPAVPSATVASTDARGSNGKHSRGRLAGLSVALLLGLLVVGLVTMLRPNLRTADPDRNAVQWTLSIGGKAHAFLTREGEEIKKPIAAVEELPDGPYTLDIDLPYDKRVTADALHRIAAAKKITRLRLPDVGDNGLETIAAMKQLRTLGVGGPFGGKNYAGAPLTDAGMKHLAKLNQLEALTIFSAHVTDAGLAPLAHHKNLRILRMFVAEVTDQGLVHLENARELERLVFVYAKITDDGFKSFRNLNKLRELQLAHSRSVTGAGLSQLGEMKYLQTLGFLSTSVNDQGLEQVGRFRTLLSLNLEDTKVTDQGLQSVFERLPKLTTINIRNNPQLTDRSVEIWTQRSGPVAFYLENTRISALGIARMHAAQPERQIHSDHSQEAIDSLIARIKNGELKETEKNRR